MVFNGKQLASIVKLGVLMSEADGRVDNNEVAVIALELTKFGLSKDECKGIMMAASNLDFSDTIPVVKGMSAEEKKHVVSFLGSIIAADGEITDEEKRICTLVSLLCGLPEITAVEAVTNFLAE